MTETFAIAGDFDAAKVESLRVELDRLAAGDHDLALDLSQSRFLDSSGVGAIVFLYKRLKARGYAISVAGLNGQPLKLLNHLGIASLLAPAGRKVA